MEVRNGSLEMAYHQGLGWFRSDFIRGEGGQMHFFVLYQVCKAYPTFFAAVVVSFFHHPKSKHLFSKGRRIPRFTRASGFELQFAPEADF